MGHLPPLRGNLPLRSSDPLPSDPTLWFCETLSPARLCCSTFCNLPRIFVISLIFSGGMEQHAEGRPLHFSLTAIRQWSQGYSRESKKPLFWKELAGSRPRKGFRCLIASVVNWNTQNSGVCEGKHRFNNKMFFYLQERLFKKSTVIKCLLSQ